MHDNAEVRVYGSILRTRVRQVFDDVRTLAARESAPDAEDWIRELWEDVQLQFPDDDVPMDTNADERRMRVVRLEAEKTGTPVLYRRMAKNSSGRVVRNAIYNKRHVLYGCTVTVERAEDRFGYVDVYIQAPGVDS